MVVQLQGGTDLLDHPITHDHNLVRHGHGLDLVVGDIDRRGAQTLMQLFDLGAHGDAQLGIEIGQWLIEQKHLRITHNGTSHGHALALAA